jgi:hypothetical protein
MASAPFREVIPEVSSVGLTGHFLEAVLADELGAVEDDILCVAAEEAGGNVLLQDDAVVFHEDLDGVLVLDVHLVAKFDGEHDAAQFVDAAYDSSRFHFSDLL